MVISNGLLTAALAIVDITAFLVSVSRIERLSRKVVIHADHSPQDFTSVRFYHIWHRAHVNEHNTRLVSFKAFNFILSKLYTNSVMSSLNSRQSSTGSGYTISSTIAKPHGSTASLSRSLSILCTASLTSSSKYRLLKCRTSFRRMGRHNHRYVVSCYKLVELSLIWTRSRSMSRLIPWPTMRIHPRLTLIGITAPSLLH